MKRTWLGKTPDSYETHKADNDLFTAIRHHSMPFVVPKPAKIEKKITLAQKLEQEVEEKFMAGEHRFAKSLKAIALILKPLFLITVLPFYLIFYLIPTWMFAQAKILKNQSAKLLSHIHKATNVAKCKFEALIAPIKKIISFFLRLKQTIEEKYSALYSRALKTYVGLKEEILKYITFKGALRKIETVLSNCLAQAKQSSLKLESKIKKSLKSLEASLKKIIESPFIYMGKKIKAVRAALLSKINLVRQRFFKLQEGFRNLKLRISGRRLDMVQVIGRSLSEFKSSLPGFPVSLTLKSLVSKPKALVNSFIQHFVDLRKKVTGYSKKLLPQKTPLNIPLFNALRHSFNLVEDKINFGLQKIKKLKSDIRHFAIHLPSQIRQKIPKLIAKITKYNAFLERFVERGRSSIYKFLNSLIPQPVRKAVNTLILFAKRSKLAITEMIAQSIFFLLLIRVWFKVIVRYLNRIILTHRINNFVQPEK